MCQRSADAPEVARFHEGRGGVAAAAVKSAGAAVLVGGHSIVPIMPCVIDGGVMAGRVDVGDVADLDDVHGVFHDTNAPRCHAEHQCES